MPENDSTHRRIFSLPQQLLLLQPSTQRHPRPARRCYSETGYVDTDTVIGARSRSVSNVSESSLSLSLGTTTTPSMIALDRPLSGTRAPQNPYELYLQGVPGAETQSDLGLTYYAQRDNARNSISHGPEGDGYWEALPAYSSVVRFPQQPPSISPRAPAEDSLRRSLSATPSSRALDSEAAALARVAETEGLEKKQGMMQGRLLCGLPIWVAGLVLVLSIIAIVLTVALVVTKTSGHVQGEQQPLRTTITTTTTTAYITTGTAQQTLGLPTLPALLPVPSAD